MQGDPTAIYAGPGPFSASVRGRDSRNHTDQSMVTPVWPQQTNIPPAMNEIVSVSRYTVTLTDLSTDPDYNIASNVPLSNTPGKYVMTRTFSSPPSMNVAHTVMDNAGASAGRARTWIANCYLVVPCRTGYTFTPHFLTVCTSTSSSDFRAN
jgi:hypothetical protein